MGNKIRRYKIEEVTKVRHIVQKGTLCIERSIGDPLKANDYASGPEEIGEIQTIHELHAIIEKVKKLKSIKVEFDFIEE
ncbi:MAG: hypothetical protein K8R21_16280 [Leptospira sp.]|nr:hypothetical protein [Leptospira sp.]